MKEGGKDLRSRNGSREIVVASGTNGGCGRKGPATIAVDFDQTIALYPPKEWRKEYVTKVCPSKYKAYLHEDLVQYLHKMKKAGHVILVYTARHWGDYKVLEAWLTKHKVPYTDIICGKLVADLYIDDKAINPNDGWWKWHDMAADTILGRRKA